MLGSVRFCQNWVSELKNKQRKPRFGSLTGLNSTGDPRGCEKPDADETSGLEGTQETQRTSAFS